MFSLLIFFTLNINLIADSPLTSTNFSRAYQNENIIVNALKVNGKLSKELLNYLVDENNPIDVKMALINALGWDFNGQTNSQKFLKYLLKIKGYSSVSDFMKNGSSDDLLCLGYLRAMDNYFDVDEALSYVEIALSKNPTSYTYNIISGLIKAQQLLDKDRCKLYNSMDIIRHNTSLDTDMREGAVNIIFEYIDLYKDSCDQLP